MNHLQLLYFLEAARTQNFSRAAEKYLVTQSCVSKQISALEQELGFSLFNRTTRSITLTAAGRHFFEKTRRIGRQFENAVAECRQIEQGERGRINLGVINYSVSPEYIRYLLNNIHQSLPYLEINVEQDALTNVVPKAVDGYYDCMIVNVCSLASTQGFCWHPLYDQEYYIVIHKNHPLYEKKDLTLADLKDEQFVSFYTPYFYLGHERFLELCGLYGFQPQKVKLVPTLESFFLHAEMGGYIALMPMYATPADNPEMRFVKIDPEYEQKYIHIGFAYPENNKNPAVEKLWQIIRDCSFLENRERTAEQ